MPKIKTALKLVRHPESVPGVIVHRVMSHRNFRGILYRYVDCRDQHYNKRSDFAHVPPAALRFRVHGDLSLHSFLETGRQCKQDIKNALTKVGKDLDSFPRILDFGCGCGHTLIWFSSNAKPSCLYGTDIDAEAIAWCRGYLNFAKFDTNRPLPPLNYPAETFDLTCAISVFIHLNEDYQFRWLSELQRVTKPKGYVLLTLLLLEQFIGSANRRNQAGRISVHRKPQVHAGDIPGVVPDCLTFARIRALEILEVLQCSGVHTDRVGSVPGCNRSTKALKEDASALVEGGCLIAAWSTCGCDQLRPGWETPPFLLEYARQLVNQ